MSFKVGDFLNTNFLGIDRLDQNSPIPNKGSTQLLSQINPTESVTKSFDASMVNMGAAFLKLSINSMIDAKEKEATQKQD